MQYRLRTLLTATFVAAIVAAFIGSALRAYWRTVDITRRSVQVRESRQAAERRVLEWLDAIPRLRRDVPPPDSFAEIEAAWVEQGKQIPSVESTLIAILEDRSSDYRRRAAYVIGRVGSAKSLDALSRIFDTGDTGLQLDAVQSIRSIHDPKCVDVLAVARESTYRLPKTPDRGIPTQKAIVRANIAIALSEIEGEPAKRLLAKLVDVEKDLYVLEVIGRLQGRPRK